MAEKLGALAWGHMGRAGSGRFLWLTSDLSVRYTHIRHKRAAGGISSTLLCHANVRHANACHANVCHANVGHSN